MNEYFRFRTGISSVDFLVNKKEIKIMFDPVRGANETGNNRAIDFSLNERYHYHRDHVGQIIKLAHIYNETTIENLVKNYNFSNNQIIKDENEAKEILMENYLRAG